MENIMNHNDFEITKPETVRELLREQFPACAQIIDEFRAAFGEVTVLEIKEAGKQHRVKNYSKYTPAFEISLKQYERLGVLSKENLAFVNAKVKRGK